MRTKYFFLLYSCFFLAGCPDPRHAPNIDGGPDAESDGPDADAWDDDWWRDVIRQEIPDDLPDYSPQVMEITPVNHSIFRKATPNFVITFDQPMDMQGCAQSLQISVMTHTPITTVYDLPGEITWSADQSILTFHPLSSPVEGSNITLSMEITQCRSLALPNYRLRESALRHYVMDELHCMRLISMAPEQDGSVISGYPDVYSDTDHLYAGTMANGDEIRTLIHMNLDVLHYYAGFDIPSEEIEFASVQLMNADPWGAPPSDIVLEFLQFSSQLSMDHFDMPAFAGPFSTDPQGIFTLYSPYEQTGFVVTEAIRTAVDNSELGVILRIRARDLVIDGVQNRVAYWAMGGPPYNEYWPNLNICYWRSWNEQYFK